MKTFRTITKWALIIIALACLTLLSLWWLNKPAALSDSSASAQRLNSATYSVQSVGIDFVDQSRSTPAMGKFKGAEQRRLNGTVWLPERMSQKIPDTHPLIIFSHGFSSYHQGCRHIAQYLARNGYIVAAVDFPLSNMRSPAGAPQLLDVANQPGDVSAVIDHILQLNQDVDSELYERVQVEKIGAMGLSLGGLTTALVSFHPELNDSRIDAAVMFAPPLEAFSDKFFNTRPELPSMLISGSFDRIVPEPANATQIQSRHPTGWFVSLDKGSHLGFANVGAWLRWTNSPDDLGCALMRRNLNQLTLPERWSEVINNPAGELLEIEVGEPCPEIPQAAMNASRQQWLTRIATGAFFDMHLRDGKVAQQGKIFLGQSLANENQDVSVRAPLVVAQ